MGNFAGFSLYIINNAVRISEAAMGGAGDIIFIISEPCGRIHPHTAIFCVDFALYYSPKGTAKLQWVGRRSKYDNIRELYYNFADFFQNWNFSL
ncbi:MAG: hypothetical protein ACK55Z_06495 [bacterium]